MSSQYPSRVDTRVVYDRETGEILHIHQAVALPGVRFPTEDELRSAALDVTYNIKGRPLDEMDVISVQEEELEATRNYRVDVEQKRLISD